MLRIFIDSNDEDLKTHYNDHIINHNSKILKDYPFSDSGFDIFIPDNFECSPNTVTKVNSSIKCAMYQDNNSSPLPFYTYPRSSISKTPLRLANQTGIIDAGYRGCLIGAFDNISQNTYNIEKFTRLLQICSPTLTPIKVILVENEDELSSETNRGSGGFGSTGNCFGYMDIASSMDDLNMRIEPVD